MRLKEVVAQPVADYVDQNDLADQLVKYLAKNASPWMNATNWGTLTFYRGVQSHQDRLYYRYKIRQNRRPRDSSEDYHQAYNAVIEVAGGVANRSNSAFITTNEQMAQNYGDVYVFMALGPFHSTYHRLWADWTAGVSVRELKPLFKDTSVLMSTKDDYGPWVENRMDEKAQAAEKELDELLKRAKTEDSYQLRSRISALEYFISDKGRQQRYHEAIGDMYMMFERNKSLIRYPSSYDPKKVKKDMVIDGDLAEAAKERVEVMVHAKSAMLVREGLYEKYLKPRLLKRGSK